MKPKLCFASLIGSLLFALAACNSRPALLNNSPFSSGPVALGATSLPSTVPTTAPTSPAAVAMKESLIYLASDELEGRGLNTTGLDLAAAFVAGNFHGAGLQPLPGMKDYFQRFDMTTADGIAPETMLAIAGMPLKLNEDYIPLSFSAEKTFDAPAIFVGYGITSKEHHYDDYTGVDVKGKVAVAWRFEPVDKDGKSKFAKEDWSDLAHLDAKAKNAADHGAIALLLANPPLFKGPDSLLPFAKQFHGSTSAIPVLHVRRPVVDALLQTQTGGDPKLLQEKIDAEPSPKAQPIEGTAISGKVAVKRTVRQLKNVVGYLPGVGPHADEYVIVGGHYDHLGRGGMGSLAPRSKEIHNGADDNGSGTAAIIELAHEFGLARQEGQTLPRSVIFIAFTAEEEGLIGSQHFVSHPPITLGSVIAMLNLDMVGRVRNETLFVGGSGTAASLESILKQADNGLPLHLKDMGKGGMGPSDHMSFAMKKVPVLFFFSGLHADYHRPTDKIEKINFNGMAEVVELSSRVIRALAQTPREAYVDAADVHSMSAGMGSGSGSKVILGIVPSYGEDPSSIKGVLISGTTPGSPAAAAGLKEGDTIVGLNGKPLDSLMDLSNVLAAAKPGDKVKLRVMRDNKEISFDATLAERK